MNDYIIGIDISKQHLDLHRLPDGATSRVSNSPTGLRELISWIGRRTVKRIVFEATGPSHRTLEQTLGQLGAVRAPETKAAPSPAPRSQFADFDDVVVFFQHLLGFFGIIMGHAGRAFAIGLLKAAGGLVKGEAGIEDMFTVFFHLP